jgi:hypothetical protein
MNIKDNNNNITFIIFDNIQNKEISGSGSKFKQYLYREIKKLSYTETTGTNLLHINDYFYQTVEMTQLLFNGNSINILHRQNCEKITNIQMVISNTKLQTYRQILYKNFSLLEQYNKKNKPFTNINITSINTKIDNFNNKIEELFNSNNIYFIKYTKTNINMLSPSNYYYLYGVKFIKN